MAIHRLAIFFLVSQTSAIFFGGGGCGCNTGCRPPPPQPTCGCAAPPPPPRPCYTPPPRCPPPPPPPPPSSYPVPLPAPLPLPQNSYSVASSYQEKVPASHYTVEPVPIEKPAPPKFDDPYASEPKASYKSKADAEDYEVLANAGYRRKPTKKRTTGKEEKCINEQLRRIIHKSIEQSSSIDGAKRSISVAAKEAFGYNFSVICSDKPFIFNVNGLYCQLGIGDVFCFAFQH